MYSKKAKFGRGSLNFIHYSLKRLLSVKERYLSTPHGRVYYLHHEVKNAPTLVLIHGFSDIPESFLPCLFSLRGKYNIILPALKGFDFEAVIDEREYSLEIYKETILCILDHYGINQFHIGGNSLGGATSLQMVKDHPEKVKSMILINSAGFEYDHIDTVTKKFLKGHNPFVVNEEKDFEALVSTIFHKKPRYPLFIENYIYEDYKSRAKQYTDIAERLFETDVNIKNGNHIIEPEDISVKTLIIWGESDGFFPVEIARDIAKKIPDSQLEVLKCSGHVPHLESPHRVQKIISRFLNTL